MIFTYFHLNDSEEGTSDEYILGVEPAGLKKNGNYFTFPVKCLPPPTKKCLRPLQDPHNFLKTKSQYGLHNCVKLATSSDVFVKRQLVCL